MKKHLITLGVVLCMDVSAARADSLDDFANSINLKWVQRDYAGINQLLSARLNANSKDVLALSIKTYFLLCTTGDLAAARAAAQRTLDAVNSSGKAGAKGLAQEIKDELASLPAIEAGRPSAEQDNLLHELFRHDLPGIIKCEILARAFEEGR